MKNVRFPVTFIVALSLAIFLFGGPANAQSLPDLVRPALQARFDGLANGSPPLCRAETPCRSARLADFYRQRAFGPAWVLRSGPSPQADRLLAVLRSVNTGESTTSCRSHQCLRTLAKRRKVDASESGDSISCYRRFMLSVHLLSDVNPNGLSGCGGPSAVWRLPAYPGCPDARRGLHLQVLKRSIRIRPPGRQLAPNMRK